MQFSHLAAIVTLLLGTYGPVLEGCETDWQEDCAGDGRLTQGVLSFGLRGSRRDASCLCLGSVTSTHTTCFDCEMNKCCFIPFVLVFVVLL